MARKNSGSKPGKMATKMLETGEPGPEVRGDEDSGSAETGICAYADCGRPVWGKHGEYTHCLFHSEKLEEKTEQFKAAMERFKGGDDGEFRRTNNNGMDYLNFRGFMFPEGTAQFGAFEFKEEVDFREAAFSGEAHFSDAKFSNKADFGGAAFSDRTNFGSVKFRGEACFWYAEFSGGANFGSATFSSNANFYRAEFSSNADFRKAAIIGKSFFSDAKFIGRAYFSDAKFSDRANFFHAEFNGGVTFGSATFSGKANFGSVTFGGEADFGSATFSDGVNFGSATFSDRADFRSATFSGETDFTVATFSDRADFGGAKFNNGANFFHVEFSGETDFTVATFSDRADFRSAKFSGEAFFNAVIFNEPFSFQYAAFSRRVEFRETTFAARADFSRISSHGRMEILGTNLSRATFRLAQTGEVLFEQVSFEKQHRSAWHRALGRDAFLGRPFDSVGDEQDGWAMRKNSPDRQKLLESAESTYRMFKRRMEEQKAGSLARRMRACEMQMRIHNTKNKVEKVLLLVYRALNGFGLRWIRVLVIWGLLLLGFAGGYWGRTAVYPIYEKTGIHAQEAVEKKAHRPLEFHEALWHSAQVSTVLTKPTVTMVEPLPIWLEGLQRLLSPFLLALFVQGMSHVFRD